MTHRIGLDQRRARLAHRHLLIGAGAGGVDVDGVARSVAALHATDPATVHLSVGARMPQPRVADVEDALYVRRTVLRMLGMRRTMFVVPTEVAPIVQAACTDSIAVEQRRMISKHLVEYADIPAARVADWLTDVENATYAALAARGAATAAQLAADEPRLRTRITLPQGSQYLTSRLLLLLAANGRIVRGRPQGSWTSSQYLWSTTEAWLPDGLPSMPADDARVALARLWLRAFGPGTLADLKWWTGWTMTHARKAVAALDTVEVDLDGATGLVLAEDVDPVPQPEPWVALLPALDPTVMGWMGRLWYLGPHAPALFDRTGNPGPTVWADGRIVGGWAQRPGGEVVFELLEQLDHATRMAIGVAAEELTAWLGPVRVTPRFRTPLERRLSA